MILRFELTPFPMTERTLETNLGFLVGIQATIIAVTTANSDAGNIFGPRMQSWTPWSLSPVAPDGGPRTSAAAILGDELRVAQPLTSHACHKSGHLLHCVGLADALAAREILNVTVQVLCADLVEASEVASSEHSPEGLDAVGDGWSPNSGSLFWRLHEFRQ